MPASLPADKPEAEAGAGAETETYYWNQTKQIISHCYMRRVLLHSFNLMWSLTK